MSAGVTRELCVMACTFCRDPQFRAWLATIEPRLGAFTEDTAKAFILGACGIASRSELDTNRAAARQFHRLFRMPYLAWKEAQQGT